MNDATAHAARRRDDAFFSVWSRRAVSLPLYFTLALLCLATAPLWLVGGLATDLLTGKARVLPRTRAFGFFALYLGVEVSGVIVAALTWLVTCGGRIGGPRRYLMAAAALQRFLTGSLFNGGAWLFSMRLEIEGLALARSGPLLLFVRHSSTADTMLTAALVANPNRLLIRYVLKRELLWDPCFDIVGRRLPNVFVDRTGARSHAEIDAIAGLARNLDAKSAVLIYPEGTRFSTKKLTAAVDTLRAKGKPELAAIAAEYRHVLPPRLGGPLAILDAAPGVDLVLIEHTGFEGAADFNRFWSGALVRKTVHVRLRRYASAAIPAADRDRWLFDRWAEMDRWISERMSV